MSIPAGLDQGSGSVAASEAPLSLFHGASVPADIRVRKAMREMNGEEALAFAGELIQRRNFAAAAAIVEKLLHHPTYGSRSRIVLAICQAGLGQHSLALLMLREQFTSAEPDLAAAIYKCISPGATNLDDEQLQELAAAVVNHVAAVTRTAMKCQRFAIGGPPRFPDGGTSA